MKVPSRTAQIHSSLKEECQLFSRLYIASQNRDGDLDNFFKHKNHGYPPSLCHLGKLRLGSKSDLTDSLEKLCTSSSTAPLVDVAAIVNMLKPVGAKTFKEYSMMTFLPYIKSQLHHVNRLDIV